MFKADRVNPWSYARSQEKAKRVSSHAVVNTLLGKALAYEAAGQNALAIALRRKAEEIERRLSSSNRMPSTDLPSYWTDSAE